MKTKPSRIGAGRIVLSALGGALAVSSAMVLSQGYRWVDRSAESGGLAYNLVWLAILMVDTLFSTPWGARGAAIGAGLGWLTISVRLKPNL